MRYFNISHGQMRVLLEKARLINLTVPKRFGRIRTVLVRVLRGHEPVKLEMEIVMGSKADVEVMIVCDLAALCEKLAKQPTVPESCAGGR